MKKLLTSLLSASALFSAMAVDYTWTGAAEGDAENWCNPTNWGKTASSDWPKSTSDKAIFPANAASTVCIPSDLSVYAVIFNAGSSVTFKRAPGLESRPQLWSRHSFTDNGIVSFELDGVSFRREVNWTPKAGASFTLRNGADLYLNDFSITAMDSVSLSGGSSMSVNSLYFNGAARTITLDDSSLNVRANAFLGTANPGGGRFIFKGANPRLTVAGVFRTNNNNANMTEKMRFDFEVPAGGFAEVPVQSYGEKTLNGQNNLPAGYFQFSVLGTSPALAAGKSLDFCAALNPRGMNRVRISNGDETTASMRFTDGTPAAADPANDDTACGINFTLGSGDPAAASPRAGALLDYKTTTVARHVITATGWVTAVANNGFTSTLELWVGEANNASAMELASSCVPTAAGSYSLSFTAPENIGEKTYYFQFRITDTDGEETRTVSTGVFNAATKDSTIYTWKDKDGDWSGDWSDPDHWESDYASAYGIPMTGNATARFPRNHAIAVTVDDNFTVGTIDLLDSNPFDPADVIDVTLLGKEGDDYGTNKVIKATSLAINAKGGRFVLDRAALRVSNEFSLGANRLFEVKNGSSFYGNGKLTSIAGGTFYVGGASHASLGAMQQENPDSTLIIDDAVLYMRGDMGHATANVTTSGGQVYFRGKAPRMRFAAGRAPNFRANGKYTMVYSFEVPVGGYEAAPISSENATVDFPQYYGANYLKFEIAPESPCFTQTAEFDTPLVTWSGTKVILSNGKNIFGDLPDGGYFT